MLTISDISFLYKISPEQVKINVANGMGIKNKPCELLEHFMHRLTIIRNLCAHGSRLFNRLFEQKPRLSKYEKTLLIKTHDGNIDNSHLYGFIFIIRKLLKKSDFIKMKNDIVELCTRYPFVNMKYYGFRDDWKDKL